MSKNDFTKSSQSLELSVTMEIVLVEGGEWVGGIVTAVEGDTVKVTNKNYL